MDGLFEDSEVFFLCISNFLNENDTTLELFRILCCEPSPPPPPKLRRLIQQIWEQPRLPSENWTTVRRKCSCVYRQVLPHLFQLSALRTCGPVSSKANLINWGGTFHLQKQIWSQMSGWTALSHLYNVCVCVSVSVCLCVCVCVCVYIYICMYVCIYIYIYIYIDIYIYRYLDKYIYKGSVSPPSDQRTSLSSQSPARLSFLLFH